MGLGPLLQTMDLLKQIEQLEGPVAASHIASGPMGMMKLPLADIFTLLPIRSDGSCVAIHRLD